MIKNGVFHRIILLIIIFLISFFGFVIIDWNDSGLLNLILYIFIVVVLGIFSLIPELNILSEKYVIARKNRFDYRNLMFLVPVIGYLYVADYNTISGKLSSIDYNFFFAFLWFSLMFIRRNNYYSISSKWIRYEGFEGLLSIIKIKFKDITDIIEEDRVIVIKSEENTLEIDLIKIIEIDKDIFIKELSKFKKNCAQQINKLH